MEAGRLGTTQVPQSEYPNIRGVTCISFHFPPHFPVLFAPDLDVIYTSVVIFPRLAVAMPTRLFVALCGPLGEISEVDGMAARDGCFGSGRLSAHPACLCACFLWYFVV